MNNLEWKAVFYNGLETNIEVTKCGRVRRIRVGWLKYTTSAKIGEIDFNKLKLSHKGYRQIGIQIKGLNSRQCQVQQLVAASYLDYKWNGLSNVVDHIDSDKLNNKVDNLRVVTHRENMSKERTIKSGLPVGVCFHKMSKKYQANITLKNKRIHLGLFETIEEASNAYKNSTKNFIII